MATSQEYLREVANLIEPEYAGALRDAADLIDNMVIERDDLSQALQNVTKSRHYWFKEADNLADEVVILRRTTEEARREADYTRNELDLLRGYYKQIIVAAKEVRLNISGIPAEMQSLIDHNGWLSKLRKIIDNESTDAITSNSSFNGLLQIIRGIPNDDTQVLRTLRAIINGKLGKRTITKEQQSKMQSARIAKCATGGETDGTF